LNYFKNLFSFFDVDYFAALIHAGLGVDAVWHLCFARVFVRIELRRFERVVGTARPRACM